MRTVIAIFNPEHDLCLANGNAHFMPPQSALQRATSDCDCMRAMYPESIAVCAANAGTAYHALSNKLDVCFIPWGWNAALKWQLLQQGIPDTLLPSDEQINIIRELSHRSVALPLKPDTHQAVSLSDIESLLKITPRIVLKAPWSGAGRGLRWVDNRLSEHDIKWCRKVISDQRCVMVEPRRTVEVDFAMEFWCDATQGCLFIGYSLFGTRNGVYQSNLSMNDDDIERHLSQWVSIDSLLYAKNNTIQWINQHITPYYKGPLGVDMFIYRDTDSYMLNSCVEINMRHTMGMVAHGSLLNLINNN
ncbi:MAG: hypothetical protein KBT04_07230 [Bacteroidales bacterium]|nr:hypothetical protein [Candidatus Colimorpha onthohippi]